MTLISDRPFNITTTDYGPSENGWWDNPLGSTVITTDATALESPSNVAIMTFPAGMIGGDAPSTLELMDGQPLTVNYTTLYVAAWVKYSSNWQSHASGVNKILHFWILGSSGLPGNKLVITGAGYVANGPLTARISLQGIVSGGNNPDGGISGTYESTAEFVRGQWHKIEVIAVANTAGANDGSVELYLDGVLATSCSGVQMVSGAGAWRGLSWSPTWGGKNDMVTNTQTESMDHIYVSGKN